MIVCNSGKFNFQDLIAHRPAFFAGICGHLRPKTFLKGLETPKFRQIQLSALFPFRTSAAGKEFPYFGFSSQSIAS